MSFITWIRTLPWEIIRDVSAEFALDPVLVAAFIMIESHGQSCATRFEPGWSYFPVKEEMVRKAKQLGISYETEVNGRQTSWGAMQIMGQVSRERGFLGLFPRLCDTRTGIYYGCKQLALLKKKYPKKEDMISAYNQGSPIKRADGIHYRNEEYVQKVFVYIQALEKIK